MALTHPAHGFRKNLDLERQQRTVLLRHRSRADVGLRLDVGDVVVAQGRTLTLRYKDGEKKVVVPEKAPNITYAPATTAMLTPGAHVIITAVRQADGSLVAQRVGVGKDGLVPPM